MKFITSPENSNYSNQGKIKEQEQKYEEEDQYGDDGDDEEHNYSNDFETNIQSPEKSIIQTTNQDQNNISNINNNNINIINNKKLNKHQRQVNFVEGFVSDTFVHREKHTPEEVSQLFYTQDEAIRFQYDYDREAQRADKDGIDWLNWMMGRSEEDRIKHEQEDELEQYHQQDYWEDNDQYELEENEDDYNSQSEEDMW